MKHAPKRFTDVHHFANVLASLNEQIDAGAACGIDYERAAEPRTSQRVRPMGSPVEDLIAQRVKLRGVLDWTRARYLTRGQAVDAWEVHRVHGVSFSVLAMRSDRPRQSIVRYIEQADKSINKALADLGMLASGKGMSATEQDKAKGVVWSSAWEVA